MRIKRLTSTGIALASAAILAAPAAAQCPGIDDSFEDNDDCASAVAITVGSHLGLHVDKADEDFYSITVQDGEVLSADIAFDSTVDVDLQLLASDCVTILDTSASVSGVESVSYANSSGGPEVINVRVYVWSGASADCNDYDMNVGVAADPCSTGVDDGLEDNDSCAAPGVGPAGLTSGLFVSKSDADYYTYTIADGATMDAYVAFIHATADVDIFLWEVAACDTGTGGALAFSWSTDDDESISYTNLTGADLDVIFHVQVWSGSGGDCNNYDMDIQGVGGGTGSIGTNYCGPANAHSGGLAGVISASGSTAVADNNVTLHSTDLPAGQFAMYINSMNQGFITPPGSSGNLCVGPAAIGRYRFDIQNTGPTGEAMLVLDLTNTPTPGGPVAIQAGETWNFQTWFRDLGGTSNFTDAIQIDFN